jgi:hypothetical protein
VVDEICNIFSDSPLINDLRRIFDSSRDLAFLEMCVRILVFLFACCPQVIFVVIDVPVILPDLIQSIVFAQRSCPVSNP